MTPAKPRPRKGVIDAEMEATGMPPAPDTPFEGGCVGRTMFDLPGSVDLGVTVLIPNDRLREVPSQSLLRISDRETGREYLGVVEAGPFAEPDGLRGDSPMLQAVATHGGSYVPPFHGRVQVRILGERLADGSVAPPRLRPLPNSPVCVLDSEESAQVLRCGGDVRLGLAAGHEGVVVGVPSASKSAFPRHTAILGTTGGGKSNTVAGLIAQSLAAGMSVILLDVEGEYTRLHEPQADQRLVSALRERGLKPAGVPVEAMEVYHLAGRDTTNPAHPNVRPFTIQFGMLSPYAVFEILNLTDAQQERFLRAYDIAKDLLRELKIFPRADKLAEDEQFLAGLDEFERGYPKITVPLLLDVIGACANRADAPPKAASRAKKDKDEEAEEAGSFEIRATSREMRMDGAVVRLRERIRATNPPGNAISWRVLLGRLARLRRLDVFFDEHQGVKPALVKRMLAPGKLNVIDLSDSGFSELNNLVIADLLHRVQTEQEALYADAEAAGEPPPRVLIIIEEAHEFLSEERIEKTRILFEQVARIAKRGRKRWLGLAFVTQLPGHLPRQVLSLCNNFVLHKLSDPQVVNLLRRTVGGIDEGLWDRLPGLAPGQAIVSFGHFQRPVLAGIDPAPCRLRMTE